KWREYRRKNPLGVERCRDSSSSPSSSSSNALSIRRPGPRVLRQSVRQLQQYYSDFLPDYFSQTERPPEEFCLSPDATTEESISVDLQQKRGLVKAINTAVDLIVAHFGTIGENSSVSPNVGHLILKYLCPAAVRDVLQDGLRAYVLDIIIGQRRNQPWSVVEASTQLGPSTRVLHNLFSKVSQYAELTNHSMRLNAFIFGLLNLRSLEFWFNHIYTHEDVIAAHYQPWGFLSLSQGACQPMLEELLLLLQPLSLLPFDLDLLFEPRQLQKGQEHLKRKEQLCSTRHGLDQSARSTFQLMRGEGAGLTLNAGRRSEAGGGESGERGVERVKGVGGEDGERERKRERSKQAGWWFQLMQSSQVYIDNSAHGSKFVKWEKRKKGGAEGRRQSHPPPREGVVEGAEANHESDERAETERTNSTSGRDRRAGNTGVFDQLGSVKGKASWMGEAAGWAGPPWRSQGPGRSGGRSGSGRRSGSRTGGGGGRRFSSDLRWGRLFGAGNTNRTEKPEQKSTKNQKSRLPSGWLSLDRSVLDLVVQSVGVGKRAEPHSGTSHSPDNQNTPNQTQQDQTEEMTPHSNTTRALCHHIATEPGHLSFHKGDVLQVAEGLVPIIYVTLNNEEYLMNHHPEMGMAKYVPLTVILCN
uniref:RUN domain-containing protein n=1 Tax=Astyanax mexicanus TaxID=7994 RepID=A0A3B1ICU2_ASTMX